eukprot:Opistho-1_new@105886
MSYLVYDEYVDEAARGWKLDPSLRRSQDGLPPSSVSARLSAPGLTQWMPRTSVAPQSSTLPSCNFVRVNFEGIPDAQPTTTRQSMLLKQVVANAAKAQDAPKRVTLNAPGHMQTVEVVTVGGFDSLGATSQTPFAYRWIEGAPRKSVERKDEHQRTLGIARVESPNEFGPKAQSFQPVGRPVEDRTSPTPGPLNDRALSMRSDLTMGSGPIRSRSPVGSAHARTTTATTTAKPPIPPRRPQVKQAAFSYMNPLVTSGYEKSPSGPNASFSAANNVASLFERRVAEISSLQAETIRWERRTAYRQRRESRVPMAKTRRDYM